MYDGEYQWIQATVLPVKEEPEQILMYSRMVHESVKAEEFYKARLWEAAQKARRAESEKTEYLRYLAQHLKNPVKTLRGGNSGGKAGRILRASGEIYGKRGYSDQISFKNHGRYGAGRGDAGEAAFL